MPKNKWWLATINNIPQDLDKTPNIEWDPRFVHYAKWQLERGAETNHLHVQVFLESHATSIKKLAPNAILEPKGWNLSLKKCDEDTNLETVSNYVSKEETRVDIYKEWGRPPSVVSVNIPVRNPNKEEVEEVEEQPSKKPKGSNQGSRTDLKVFYEGFKRKTPLDQIVGANEKNFGTFVKFPKGLETAAKMFRVPLKTMPMVLRDVNVVFIYGPTGTGKTHYAFENYSDIYVKPDGNDWFTYYNGEKTLFIDEFEGWMTPSFTKKVLDKYPCPIRVHHGMDHACWDTVVIASNLLPNKWWSSEVYTKNPGLVDQITRRFSTCIYIPERGVNYTYKNYQDFMNLVTQREPFII